MKNRIMITLVGGLVSDVVTNIPDCEYVVIDRDLPETEDLEDIDIYPQPVDVTLKEEEKFSHTWVWNGHTSKMPIDIETKHFITKLKEHGW